jgi:hypothetical protein
MAIYKCRESPIIDALQGFMTGTLERGGNANGCQEKGFEEVEGQEACQEKEEVTRASCAKAVGEGPGDPLGPSLFLAARAWRA